MTLACISHRLTVEADDRPAITSLGLLAVLTVLSKYASARQAARASHPLRLATRCEFPKSFGDAVSPTPLDQGISATLDWYRTRS